MRKFVFLGPTLSISELQGLGTNALIIQVPDIASLERNLYDLDAIVVLPPVAGGDLLRLCNFEHPFLVAIIDGYFENCASVWHKEVLYLLSQGTQVLGAASMGALRAAELSVFGMRGFGKIYQDFSHGILEDDDEVTVSHGPAELEYPVLSEAMVNIRYTLHAAFVEGVLSLHEQDWLRETAKSAFYKNRNYETLIRQCHDLGGIAESSLLKFKVWLKENRVDQKKRDAITLIRHIANQATSITELPKFEFEDTFIWRHCLSEPG